MTVTLETLRADFEKARHAFHHYAVFGEHNVIDHYHRYLEVEPDFISDHWVPGVDGTGYDPKLRDPMIEAADIYTIAVRFGLNAAMIFKLSDGAIDPRKAGA